MAADELVQRLSAYFDGAVICDLNELWQKATWSEVKGAVNRLHGGAL